MKGQDIVLLYKLLSLEQRPVLTNANTSVVLDVGLSPEEHDLASVEALSSQSSPFSVRSLATETGIGKTEVAKALERCQRSGLLTSSRGTTHPQVNMRGLEEFSIYGLRYVFPVTPGRLCRGLPTSLVAPVFDRSLLSGGDAPPVWADPLGETMGVEVSPLFKSVPQAVKRDERLYRYLAVLDSLRMGQSREVKLATEELMRMLKEKS